jgi:hypothetical protein
MGTTIRLMLAIAPGVVHALLDLHRQDRTGHHTHDPFRRAADQDML